MGVEPTSKSQASSIIKQLRREGHPQLLISFLQENRRSDGAIESAGKVAQTTTKNSFSTTQSGCNKMDANEAVPQPGVEIAGPSFPDSGHL